MAGNGGSSDRDLTSQELGADSRLCPWSCENSERASTEGNRVLLALRVPSRLATGRANIARERKIVLRVPNAPAFSHGQDPEQTSTPRYMCNPTSQLHVSTCPTPPDASALVGRSEEHT